METYKWQNDDDFIHPSVSDHLHALISYAMENKKSLPDTHKCNPLKGCPLAYIRCSLHPYSRENTLRLLCHLKKIRYSIVCAIEDARIPNIFLQKFMGWLRRLEEHSTYDGIRIICSMVRNSIAATDFAPIFKNQHEEKHLDLGARLYHIEDIILKIEEELPSKPSIESAIVITDGSQAT